MTFQNLDIEKLATNESRKITDAIEVAEGNVYYVGGRIRDLLLDHPLGDIDLTTDLSPEQMKSALKQAKIPFKDFAIQHGTIMAIPGPIEITSFRQGHQNRRKTC